MDQNNMPERSGSMGSLIAIIVILAVIVLGALFFWKNRAAAPAEQNKAAQSEESDTAAALEAELNTTDVESVDYDLNEENFNAS